MKKSREEKEEEVIEDFNRELDLSDNRVRKRLLVESSRQSVFVTEEGKRFLRELAAGEPKTEQKRCIRVWWKKRQRRILITGSIVLVVLGVTGFGVYVALGRKEKKQDHVMEGVEITINLEEISEQILHSEEGFHGIYIEDGRFKSKTYVIAGSDENLLTEEDIIDLTYEQLTLALKEIYARHGRTFYDDNIQAYFNAKTWYQPLPEGEKYSDQLLNDVERSNVLLLKETLDWIEAKNSSVVYDYSSLTIDDMLRYISSVNLMNENSEAITDSTIRALFYDFLESGYITKGKWNLKQMGAI